MSAFHAFLSAVSLVLGAVGTLLPDAFASASI
jgi:hypothetical protein